MVFSGQAAAILALVGTATGDPLAPIGVTIAASLLLVGYTVSPNRRWSVRFGSIIAPLGLPVWVMVLLGMDRYDDPSITLLCVAMAGASWWAATFLRDELRPPEWLRAPRVQRADDRAAMSGWIEDLPVSELGIERPRQDSNLRPAV